jgi:Cu/Ag efflux protein CusF
VAPTNSGETNLKANQQSLVGQSVYFCVAIIFVTFLSLSGCRSAKTRDQSSVTGPAAAVQTKTYHGVGVVKSIDLKRPSIEIDHQEIVGLMEAMTMEFYVKDQSLLAGLSPGDHIEFTIENGVGGIKITAIHRL